jgi:hypothetical protein
MREVIRLQARAREVRIDITQQCARRCARVGSRATTPGKLASAHPPPCRGRAEHVDHTPFDSAGGEVTTSRVQTNAANPMPPTHRMAGRQRLLVRFLGRSARLRDERLAGSCRRSIS